MTTEITLDETPEPTGVTLDPAVEAQIGQGKGPSPQRRARRQRREARQATVEQSSGNTPVNPSPVADETPEAISAPPQVAPASAELSRNEKVDILWEWFQNTGSKLHQGAQPATDADVDLMRCSECGQVFETPAYAIRLRDGLPARCPNPAHGTKLYPAEFL